MGWQSDLHFLGAYDKALSLARELGPQAAARYVHSSHKLLCKIYHPDANPHCPPAAKEGMLRLNRIKERLDRAGGQELLDYLGGNQAKAPSNGTRILLVEPDPEMGEQISQGLMQEGYLVHSVSNGVQGMAGHFEFSPTVVLSALHLPFMDGLSMVRELTSCDPELKVIIMCEAAEPGSDASHHKQRLESLGYAVIEKPFKPSHLFSLIRSSLAA